MNKHLPAGSPKWVTPELIKEAIEVFSLHQKHKLTEDEGLEIILDFDRLFKVLEEQQ